LPASCLSPRCARSTGTVTQSDHNDDDSRPFGQRLRWCAATCAREFCSSAKGHERRRASGERANGHRPTLGSPIADGETLHQSFAGIHPALFPLASATAGPQQCWWRFLMIACCTECNASRSRVGTGLSRRLRCTGLSWPWLLPGPDPPAQLHGDVSCRVDTARFIHRSVHPAGLGVDDVTGVQGYCLARATPSKTDRANIQTRATVHRSKGMTPAARESCNTDQCQPSLAPYCW